MMTTEGGTEQGEAASGAGRVRTGVPGLDLLLEGGLLRGGLHVLCGGPGTGKSVLAHQIGVNAILSGGKVLYLTALVETHQMIIAQARTFRFFNPQVVASSFYYASLYPAIARGGLDAVREEISRLVAQHQPSLVIMDGVHAFKVAGASALQYQHFMHEMEARAAVTGVTTLLLTHPGDPSSPDPTFTIADTIFYLRMQDVRSRSERQIKVEKARGVAHIGGWHSFRLTGDGFQLFPRLESIRVSAEENVAFDASGEAPRRVAGFQVEGLDEVLGGSIAHSAVTLVVGTPGSGKTLLGLAFLAAGARTGERGLMLSFHERPPTLVQKADSVNLPLRQAARDGTVDFSWWKPAELLADDVADRLFRLVEERGIRRLVIDTVDTLRHAIIPRERELSFLAALADSLRDRGVTTLLTQNIPRIAGASFDLPLAELPGMMDNVVCTRYVEESGALRRVISVLKVAAGECDETLRELRISSAGMRIGG